MPTNAGKQRPRRGPAPATAERKERPASRSQVVAKHVLGKISSGELKPGDKLPSEAELMDLLDVGRSSIREALSGLSLVGMLQMTRRRGTVVVASSLGELSDELRQNSNYWIIRDLEQVRILLEGFAAARAAEVADEQALAEISEAARKVEVLAKRKQSYFNENILFHLSIAKAGRNSALVFCLGSIIERFRDARESLNWTPIVRERDVREHRQIYEAIRDRQPGVARALMEAHLNRNITRLEKPEQSSE